jgi:hypothetical protein
MAMTLFEAAKLSRDKLARGVLLAVATSDELIGQLPMVPTTGKSYDYDREKALAAAEWVAPDHSSLTESSTTFAQVNVPLRLLVSDVDTYDFAQEQMSELNDQRSLQLRKKLKAAGRTIANAAINGDSGSTIVATPGMAGVTYDDFGPLQDTDRTGFGELFYDQSAGLLYW